MRVTPCVLQLLSVVFRRGEKGRTGFLLFDIVNLFGLWENPPPMYSDMAKRFLKKVYIYKP